ncbi:hypothetical protein BDQ17DRAFT_1342411 [Cyathus striatus]|nr:hypothetical protein BDQ17DRAFT_1342411 [Cyathus striatus]
MQDLPHHVWYQVGQYLSSRDLHQMMSLNTAFFQVFLRCRYKEIEIHGWHKNWRRKLERVRDPMIGKYVTQLQLSINATFVERSDLGEFLDEIMSSMDSIPNLSGLSLCGSAYERVDPESFDLVDTLPELDNELNEFFISLWKKTGGNLRRLEISGMIRFCQLAIPPAPSLPALEQLIVDIPYLHESNFAQDSLFDQLLPFINDLAEQLHMLEFKNINICGTTDIGLMFSRLTMFPNLEELSLGIWGLDAEQCFTVRQFIVGQASMSKQLALNLELELSSLDYPLETVLLCSTREQPFPNGVMLSALTISGEFNLNNLLNIIPKHAQTLQHLDIRNWISTNEDIQCLTSSVSKLTELTSLSIFLGKLDVNILSPAFSHIRKLKIHCWEIGMWMIVPWPYLRTKLEAHRAQLRQWKLNDLSIFLNCFALEHKTMKRFTQLIPSVQSFYGTGDMQTPPDFTQVTHKELMKYVMRSSARSRWNKSIGGLRRLRNLIST